MRIALLSEYGRIEAKKSDEGKNVDTLIVKKNAPSTSKENNQRGTKEGKHKVKCFKCGKLGHFAKECRTKISGSSQSRKNNAENNTGALLIEANATQRGTNTKWYVNTGATDHFCYEKEIFLNLKLCKGESARVPDGNLRIEGTGTVVLQLQKMKLTFNEVLYVPDLHKNLMSGSSIVEAGAQAHLYQNKIRIYTPGKWSFDATLREKLFLVEAKSIQSKSQELNLLNATGGIADWHRRLGHCGEQTIKKMAKEDIVIGRDNVTGSIGICGIY